MVNSLTAFATATWLALLLFFIGVELLYTVVSVSAAQQSASTIHIHIFPLFNWLAILILAINMCNKIVSIRAK